MEHRTRCALAGADSRPLRAFWQRAYGHRAYPGIWQVEPSGGPGAASRRSGQARAVAEESRRSARCCSGGTLVYHLCNVRRTVMTASPLLDVGLHERRRASRMRDPEYRRAYQRAAREIAQTDAVIRELDELRVEVGMSKAELARRVGRNAASVRRLFTAARVRPEFPLLAALADALGAE